MTANPSLRAFFALLAFAAMAPAQIALSATQQIYCGPSAQALAGDVTGDGAADIVLLRENSNAIGIMPNDGHGNLGGAMLFQLAAVDVGAIVIGRFDPDSDLDVAGVGRYTSGPAAPGQVGVALNTGLGTFPAPVTTTLPTNAGASNLAAGYVNNDGALDLVCLGGSSNESLQIMINNGNGTFAQGANIAVDVVHGVGVADVDNDGDRDLVLGRDSGLCNVSVYKNNGQGFFSLFATIVGGSGGSGPKGIACGDLDNDGDVDVVVSRFPANSPVPGTGGNLLVFRNPGNGSFAAPVLVPVGTYPRDIVLSDLDSDGALDIVVTDASAYGIYVLRNTGNAAFTIVASRPCGVSSIVASDLDGDGDEDLVGCGDGELSIIRNLRQPSAIGPYPGTGEDLFLLTGVNATPTTGTGLTVKTAHPGDLLAVRLSSPGGAFTGAPFVLAAELFTTGMPPAGPPGVPAIHLSGAGLIVLATGAAGPFSYGVPGSGLLLPLTVPPGLAGQSVLLQAAAYSSGAANGIFATTDAHEIRFVP